MLRGLLVAFAVLSIFLLWHKYDSGVVAQTIKPRPAPEFSQTDASAWLNSPPLKMADLRGKVVLIDFWTFDCWNCYRSFPWLNALEEKLSDQDFQVIGIHTPEFEHEKVRDNVVEKIAEFGLKHPSMMDNDFQFWQSMQNRYWPSYYLIDKRGFIRNVFIGETHADSQRAKSIEATINTLLAEEV